MKNIKMSVKKNILTITVDLNAKAEASASGKSMVIASTNGNQTVMIGDSEIKIGVNIYTPVKTKNVMVIEETA